MKNYDAGLGCGLSCVTYQIAGTKAFSASSTGLAAALLEVLLLLTLLESALECLSSNASLSEDPMISAAKLLTWCLISMVPLLGLSGSRSASAATTFKRIPVQYIASLGAPDAKSGSNASAWGLWAVDPGPRGVRLSAFDALKASGFVAPTQWTFDSKSWWLEEHGLIMEQPSFPLPPGQYVVTGGREVTAVLTVHPKGGDGLMHWGLSDSATLYDVTHLRCRAAVYTPAAGDNSCTPKKANPSAFPVEPGAAMPPVEGCEKQDFQVLIVIGVGVEG